MKEGHAIVESTGYVATMATADGATNLTIDVAGEVKQLNVTVAPTTLKVSGIVSSLKATVATTIINTGK